MSSKPINRITMFKIPNDDDLQASLDAYTTLKETAKKDDAPYLLSCHAARTYPDPRNQGFNLVAQTTFKSLDDMRYYDEQCDAHKKLKSVVGPKQQGVMMVYMDAPESG